MKIILLGLKSLVDTKQETICKWQIGMFYLNSALNFGIPPVLIFQLEVYYKVDRLLTDLTAQQKEQLLDGIQIKHLYLNQRILLKVWLDSYDNVFATKMKS